MIPKHRMAKIMLDMSVRKKLGCGNTKLNRRRHSNKQQLIKRSQRHQTQSSQRINNHFNTLTGERNYGDAKVLTTNAQHRRHVLYNSVHPAFYDESKGA